MNKLRNNLGKLIFAILSFYALMIVLLYAVESQAGDVSAIHGIGDALWYVLATLTTVGYGDVTPVTGAGKVIGAVMMISSAGILTFLLGLTVAAVFGSLLPRLRLWSCRDLVWYVFSECNEHTVFLAGRLAAEDPEAAFIFCGKAGEEELPLRIRHTVITELPIRALLRRQESSRDCHIFLMRPDGWKNYEEGLGLLKEELKPTARIYCETKHRPEKLPANLVLFDRPDNTARSYWFSYPAEEAENIFVLAGSGEMAERLLERGLLTNIFPGERRMEYHLFGDWERFKLDHYGLSGMLGIDEFSSSEDSIFFHDESWNHSPELLLKAHRIIFCGDDEHENLLRMEELFRYFPVKGKVYIYGNLEDSRAGSFGGDAKILDRENVMQEGLNRTAKMMNSFYCSKTGGGCAWEELSEFHRQSNIAAADHIFTKLRILLPEERPEAVTGEACRKAYEKYRALTAEEKEDCRRLEHRRWMRFHIMNNWSYAEVRDNELRHHRLIVPYEELTPEEQALDDSAWEILGEAELLWETH